MDHANPTNRRPRTAATKWGAGRPPPPPLSLQEGLPPASSSGFGRHFVLEDRSRGDALISLGFRTVQAISSLLSFSLMVSANQSFSYHTGFTKMSLDLKYSDFAPFGFLVAAMVLCWIWSMGIMVVDILELCGWGRLHLERWRIWTCFLIDVMLLHLSFGAGCAAAGLTTLNGLFCDSQIEASFCKRTGASAALPFVVWAALLPSFGISLICVFRDYN